MTTLDIVLLIVFVVSVAYGFKKGIIVQAGSLGGIIFGVLLCRLAGPWLTGVIAGGGAGWEAAQPTYVDSILAKIILFIAGYLSVKAVAHFCKQLSHAMALGALDRLGGALFSLFQWMLVLSILLNMWIVIKPQTDFNAMSTLGNGHAIEAVVGLAPALMGWMTNM